MFEPTKSYDLSAEEIAKMKKATIETEKGTIIVTLFPEDTPQTVANFGTLIKDGFYDGLTFHRVIPNFVIQGGCPQGTGTGGPGWRIKCETKDNEHKHERGSLSMAHAGPDTGGSQFFVCHSPQAHLDGLHTVFGQVQDEDSLKVVDDIRAGDKMLKVTLSED